LKGSKSVLLTAARHVLTTSSSKESVKRGWPRSNSSIRSSSFSWRSTFLLGFVLFRENAEVVHYGLGRVVGVVEPARLGVIHSKHFDDRVPR
jgi:hypothetical protein